MLVSAVQCESAVYIHIYLSFLSLPPTPLKWSESVSHSVVSNSFAIPWTITCQAPLPMGFSRQEYWSGLPFLPPEDIPHPAIEPLSLASLALARGFFTTRAIWEDWHCSVCHFNLLTLMKQVIYFFLISQVRKAKTDRNRDHNLSRVIQAISDGSGI